MTLSLTCKRCDQTMTGENEDELVRAVQEHVRGHARLVGRFHTVTREQVLKRLEHEQRRRNAEPGDEADEAVEPAKMRHRGHRPPFNHG